MLRIVADETARASYDMLENLIKRASELRLDPKPSSKKTSKRASPTKSSVGSSKFSSDGDYQSGGLSDTSGALRSDDNFPVSGTHSNTPNPRFSPVLRKTEGGGTSISSKLIL